MVAIRDRQSLPDFIRVTVRSSRSHVRRPFTTKPGLGATSCNALQDQRRRQYRVGGNYCLRSSQSRMPDAGARALGPPGLERPELPSSIRHCRNPKPMVDVRVLDSVRPGRSPGRNFTSGISETPAGATAGRGLFSAVPASALSSRSGESARPRRYRPRNGTGGHARTIPESRNAPMKKN